MQTETLVRASADVVQITTLRQGDVYKRIEKNYSDDYRAVFGVVQSVDFNGDDAMISAIEFDMEYRNATPKQKVWGTGNNLRLFTATPDEVRVHFAEVLDVLENKIEAAKKSVIAAEDELELATKIQFNIISGQLTTPATRGLAEIEAEQRQAEIEAIVVAWSCANCNHDVTDDEAQFCPKCGTSRDWTPSDE